MKSRIYPRPILFVDIRSLINQFPLQETIELSPDLMSRIRTEVRIFISASSPAWKSRGEDFAPGAKLGGVICFDRIALSAEYDYSRTRSFCPEIFEIPT